MKKYIWAFVWLLIGIFEVYLQSFIGTKFVWFIAGMLTIVFMIVTDKIFNKNIPNKKVNK